MSDLTQQTLSGYYNPRASNPFDALSPYWLAFRAGQALWDKGVSRPVKAKKSRGSNIRIYTHDNEFIIDADPKHFFPVIERR